MKPAVRTPLTVPCNRFIVAIHPIGVPNHQPVWLVARQTEQVQKSDRTRTETSTTEENGAIVFRRACRMGPFVVRIAQASGSNHDRGYLHSAAPRGFGFPDIGVLGWFTNCDQNVRRSGARSASIDGRRRRCQNASPRFEEGIPGTRKRQIAWRKSHTARKNAAKASRRRAARAVPLDSLYRLQLLSPAFH